MDDTVVPFTGTIRTDNLALLAASAAEPTHGILRAALERNAVAVLLLEVDAEGHLSVYGSSGSTSENVLMLERAKLKFLTGRFEE